MNSLGHSEILEQVKVEGSSWKCPSHPRLRTDLKILEMPFTLSSLKNSYLKQTLPALLFFQKTRFLPSIISHSNRNEVWLCHVKIAGSDAAWLLYSPPDAKTTMKVFMPEDSMSEILGKSNYMPKAFKVRRPNHLLPLYSMRKHFSAVLGISVWTAIPAIFL